MPVRVLSPFFKLNFYAGPNSIKIFNFLKDNYTRLIIKIPKNSETALGKYPETLYLTMYYNLQNHCGADMCTNTDISNYSK